MASPAVAIRNQQNAQHSTGPRTAEGKQVSSLNAVRHGLTSQLVVLPTEDHDAYTTFRAGIFADLTPEGATEEMLVQTVCDTHWRLERARKGEANILALAQYESQPPEIASLADPIQRAALTEGRAWIVYERALRNLQHHEARLQRLLLKALGDFHALQEIHRFHRQALLDEATNTKIHHQANNLPFDPVALGFVFTAQEIDRELKRIHVLRHPHRPFPPPTPTRNFIPGPQERG